MGFTDYDHDTKETTEWIQALYDVYQQHGAQRAEYILNRLNQFYTRNVSGILPTTDYTNTLPPNLDADYPDTDGLDKALEHWVAYNALSMVLRAGDKAPELGGHLATYASIAQLYEVGLNYFFHGRKTEHLGDMVYFQGHSSPGIYARSYMAGTLSADLLNSFRQEALSPGLSSYPHPWLMPNYWSFPTVSMGLGPYASVYQARFVRYLEHRGLIPAQENRHVWAFCGDGEMDEPESTGALNIAAREKLDNLIFIVNCNLQRLDGPVRGNHKVVQELEATFRGAGWYVIKLLWNSAWDRLFVQDKHGYLRAKLMQMPDGEMQNYGAQNGKSWQHDFFGTDPILSEMTKDWSDADFAALGRGGHDNRKIYAAYQTAVKHKNQPVVILAQTIKGFQLGGGIAGANAAHQKKKMQAEVRCDFVKQRNLPISEAEAASATICKPADDDPVMQYLKERVEALGHVPKRYSGSEKLAAPSLDLFESILNKATDKPISSTMSFVRILNLLLKDKGITKHIVPIVPDEARTFGMEGLFRQIGIYAPDGQNYDPVDKGQIMYYREARDGQVLQEGLNEAGGISSWLAAATSYSTNALGMVPFYIYYSMFGFQRVGDFIWAAGDMRARGFLVGATAGGTTLSGEGLQHLDGHSQVMAGLVPNCISYDPCYGYELAVIIQDGIRRMYVEQEDVFYYLTVMNENYMHPQMPEGVEDDIIKGMYCLVPNDKAQINLLGSGTILNEVNKARTILAEQFAVEAAVWSVTSFNQLGRDVVLQQEQAGHQATLNFQPQTFVGQKLNDSGIPVLAATDYVRAYAEQIRPALTGSYLTLGTDGFGCSDTRANLRKYFAVDANTVAYYALYMLAQQGHFPEDQLLEAQRSLGVYLDRDYMFATTNA